MRRRFVWLKWPNGIDAEQLLRLLQQRQSASGDSVYEQWKMEWRTDCFRENLSARAFSVRLHDR